VSISFWLSFPTVQYQYAFILLISLLMHLKRFLQLDWRVLFKHNVIFVNSINKNMFENIFWHSRHFLKTISRVRGWGQSYWYKAQHLREGDGDEAERGPSICLRARVNGMIPDKAAAWGEGQSDWFYVANYENHRVQMFTIDESSCTKVTCQKVLLIERSTLVPIFFR
jgi:hypothetical protein